MFTRLEHKDGQPCWIEVKCVKCSKVETFGTATAWPDGQITALISRLQWDNLHNLCPRCSREHFD